MNVKKIALFTILTASSSSVFAVENHFLRYNEATNTLDIVGATTSTASTHTPIKHRAIAYPSEPAKTVTAKKACNITAHPKQRATTCPRKTCNIAAPAPVIIRAATGRSDATPTVAPYNSQPAYTPASSNYQPRFGFYVSAKGSLEYATINNLEDNSIGGQYTTQFAPGTNPLTTTSINQFSTGTRIAIGMNLPSINNNIALRPEIEYGTHFGVGYNVNDIYNIRSIKNVFTNDTLSSDIFSQTLMLKLYTDINIQNSPLMPYFMAGVGASQNQVTSKTLITPFAAPEQTVGNNHVSNTTNFAWSLGLGARYAINQALLLDIGYEFLNLGKLNWGPFPTNVTDPNTNALISSGIEAKNFYINSILLGITWNFY